MSDSFKALCRYMNYIAGTMEYTSWSDSFFRKEFLERQKNAKTQFECQAIKWDEISNDEYKLLGFRDFDENTKNLIPLWLFKILPDDTKVISFSGNQETIKTADDDVRFGCTAFMLVL